MRLIISWLDRPVVQETVTIQGCGDVPVLFWGDALKVGNAQRDSLLNLGATQPGRRAAIIYTSGTTGEPKGVLCSHNNLSFVGRAVVKEMSCVGFGEGGEVCGLSYLPLLHIAGLCIDIIGPMSLTARSPGWEAMFFTRPYASRLVPSGSAWTW